jgi:hypothetical protein
MALITGECQSGVRECNASMFISILPDEVFQDPLASTAGRRSSL